MKSLWKTGGPGVLWSMGSRRVGHDFMTKQQQQQMKGLYSFPSSEPDFSTKPSDISFWNKDRWNWKDLRASQFSKSLSLCLEIFYGLFGDALITVCTRTLSPASNHSKHKISWRWRLTLWTIRTKLLLLGFLRLYLDIIFCSIQA